ncbi:v-type ATP synthase beta chain [Striga asiatica]|uniref:V-type ATP synthase beta chain n=1 Tax=Striga asiatica TaxID=4170 RepID=A0A5A7RIF2_STRAF|nr:v-type ATP synthase beta chain [Striga asiatica]
MEAILLRGPLDQSISPHKSQIRNPSNIRRPFISMPSDSFPPPDSHTIGGLFRAQPPFLSHSYPPYQAHQPPLLPLPSASGSRKPNNGGGRTRGPSLTPNKSKFPRKEAVKPYRNAANGSRLASSSGKIVDYGADYCVGANGFCSAGSDPGAGAFSGSAAFGTSPPPSSLPLPTFTLRPKLAACRAEVAAGIDAGATDDLRRLLRIR